MWKECTKCGLWQNGPRPCQACSWPGSSWQGQAAYMQVKTCAHGTPVFDVAAKPKQIKIENFCGTCFVRTLGSKSSCRGCQSDLTNGMRIVPSQWPHLNCPDHVLRRFDNGSAPVCTNSGGDVTTHWSMSCPDNQTAGHPVQGHTTAQFKTE